MNSPMYVHRVEASSQPILEFSILAGGAQIGEALKNAVQNWPVRLTTVGDEGVVVSVGLADEVVRESGLVGVEHREVGLGEVPCVESMSCSSRGCPGVLATPSPWTSGDQPCRARRAVASMAGERIAERQLEIVASPTDLLATGPRPRRA